MISAIENAVARAERNFSSTEREVFLSVKKFMDGIAQKKRVLLNEVLDNDARIELRRQSGKVVGKDAYIHLVTADSSHYRNDFKFFDVTIEVRGNEAWARGMFMFCHELLPSSILTLNLVRRNDTWLVISNFFRFLDFPSEFTWPRDESHA